MAERLPTIALLAGGLATRLHPITKTIPKSMVVVAGEPFIAHQLRLLHRSGFRSVVVCTGHLGAQITQFVGTGRRFGCAVSYSFDGDRPMGTGGALRKALPLLSDVFMVIYGDSYLQTDFRQVYSAFLTSNADALMTVFENDDRFDRSNAEFANGRVLRYTKGSRTPDMKYIDYGLGVFRRETLLRVPPERPFDLAELYESLAESGRLAGIEVRDRFFEIGSPQGLAETEAFIETTSSVASLVSAT